MSGWVVGFALRHEADQRLLHSVAVVAAVVVVVVVFAVVDVVVVGKYHCYYLYL